MNTVSQNGVIMPWIAADRTRSQRLAICRVRVPPRSFAILGPRRSVAVAAVENDLAQRPHQVRDFRRAEIRITGAVRPGRPAAQPPRDLIA